MATRRYPPTPTPARRACPRVGEAGLAPPGERARQSRDAAEGSGGAADPCGEKGRAVGRRRRRPGGREEGARTGVTWTLYDIFTS